MAGRGILRTPRNRVTADREEEALEIYCRIIIDDGRKDLYLSPEEVTEEDEESGQYIYIDGTMSGAKYPVYLRAENLRIIENDECR